VRFDPHEAMIQLTDVGVDDQGDDGATEAV
jgi:hypothetical protein